MRVEYYRGWPGGRWDTDMMDIHDGTPDDRIDEVIRHAVYNKMSWPDEVPVFAGLYHQPPEEGE